MARPPRSPKPPPKHPLPCVHLGRVVKRAGSCCPRKNTHECAAGMGRNGGARPAFECEECPRYEPDDATATDTPSGDRP